MKTRLFTAAALCLLFLCSRAFASADDSIVWTQQNKGIRTLFDVCFIDSLHGWACGDYWTLYKTTDGGAHWVQMPFKNSDSLRCLFFLDCSTGFVGSNTGRIYQTLDSGRVWSQGYYRDGWLNEIRFQGSDTGWAVGAARRSLYSSNAVIYTTHNRGQSWDSIAVSGPYDLTCIRNPDGTHLFAAGYNYLIASASGGMSWNGAVSFLTIADSAFDSTNGYINSVDFQSASRGLAVGRYGHILRTEDSGASWATARPRDWTWLEDVRYVDSTRAIIAAERGAVFSTADGGYTWTKRYPRHQSSLEAPWFRKLFCLDSEQVWMVGDSSLIMKGRFATLSTAVQKKNEKSLVQNMPVMDVFSTHSGEIPITYNLAEPAHVVFALFNVDGRCLTRLDRGYVNAGEGFVQWRPNQTIGTGVHVVKMVLNGRVACAALCIIIK